MKRIFELAFNDFFNMKKREILETIRHSEGRTVVAECVISCPPLIYGVSNAELAASFGADMITLNTFDFEKPFIFGIDDEGTSLSETEKFIKNYFKKIEENRVNADYIKKVKSITGRFIGVNLEPVPESVKNFPKGRRVSKENLEKARFYGFDYVVITANPNTGVSSEDIVKSLELCREILEEDMIIIAGKMHAAGRENVFDPQVVKGFAINGADVVLIPAPGTVPGMDMDTAKRLIREIHSEGALAMTAIGTSQEGAGRETIRDIAMLSKMAGADIQHIGDAGFSGMAFPENIMELSITIRGKRHTYRRMGYSSRK